jgi:NAD(P)H-hydrate repair Nnr-like enzyme with NAD(P)H-hydrate dehydratase domain
MSDLTDDIKEAASLVLTEHKAKIKNIYGGIRALPSFLKKQKKVNKKYGETDLLKGKNYYPPKP